MSIKRGQASFEFLSTYMWVLVVVLVSTGAMAYFNVFDLQRYLPTECEFGQNIVCEDWAIDKINVDFEMNLMLRNNLERTIEPVSVAVYNENLEQLNCNAKKELHCPYNHTGDTDLWRDPGTGIFEKNETPEDWTVGKSCRLIVNCADNLIEGRKTSIYVNLTFKRKTPDGNAPEHQLRGRVFGEVRG